MCRLVGWVATQPMTALEAVGEEGIASIRNLAVLHADGWGIAAQGREGPKVSRSTMRADRDDEFGRACSETATEIGLLHLRWATPGLPVELINTHPFQDGDLTFAHNGAIYPTNRLDEMLEPSMRPRLRGTTDSERYFRAVLAEIERGAEPPDAFVTVTSRLAQDFTPSSLNAILTIPGSLYAVNCHDPAAAPNAGSSAASAIADETALNQTPYFDLSYRVRADSVVVASSGIAVGDPTEWQTLDNDSVLAVDRGTLATRTLRLRSGLPQGAPIRSISDATLKPDTTADVR